LIGCGSEMEPVAKNMAGSGGTVGGGGAGGSGGSGGSAGAVPVSAIEENCADYCAWWSGCITADQDECVEACAEKPRHRPGDFAGCLACTETATCDDPFACGAACSPSMMAVTVSGSGYPGGGRHMILISEDGRPTAVRERVNRGPNGSMTSQHTFPEGASLTVESFFDLDGDGGCNVDSDEVLRFDLVLDGPQTVDVSYGVESGAPPSCERFLSVLSYDAVVTLTGLPVGIDGFVHASLIGETSTGYRFVAEHLTVPAFGDAVVRFSHAARHYVSYSVAWRFVDELEACSAEDVGGTTVAIPADRTLHFPIEVGAGTASCSLLPGYGGEISLAATGFAEYDGGWAVGALVDRESGVVLDWVSARIENAGFTLDFGPLAVPGIPYRIAVDAGTSVFGSCPAGTPATWWVDVPASGAATLDATLPMADDVCLGAFQLMTF
jgi:hypothetical protein